ncbi:MAG: CinA family protein [Actinomycetes bacterium]
MSEASPLAARLVHVLRDRGLTLAVAESLTGGLVMASLTAVPGASAVLRGGAVVYATDTKASQLGVDAALLDSRGPVDPLIAEAMAVGARTSWQADIGLATTGVAGPDRLDGHPVGEVYVAVADGSRQYALPCSLGGLASREAIRLQTVDRALIALAAHIGIAGEAPAG